MAPHANRGIKSRYRPGDPFKVGDLVLFVSMGSNPRFGRVTQVKRNGGDLSPNHMSDVQVLDLHSGKTRHVGLRNVKVCTRAELEMMQALKGVTECGG